jgi:hypothetical protein
MNMLAMLHGKERNLIDFDILLGAAGLRCAGLSHLQSPYCVLEAVAE